MLWSNHNNIRYRELQCFVFRFERGSGLTMTSVIDLSRSLTFRPLARLMALRGRSTRRTLRIFTTEMADDLERNGMDRQSKWTLVYC